MKLVRALGTLVLTAALTVTAPAAFAADPPPATSTGFTQAAWTNPSSNHLFDVSATSFTATAGLGSSSATSAAVTITAHQDIQLRSAGWSSNPDTNAFHRAGACPDNGSMVQLTAGDVCQFWFTFGPTALNTWASQISGTTMTATSVADGSTASTYVGANLTALHLELGGAVDFGQVALGSTSAARTVSLRNITPNPVEIDLAQVDALADFGLAPGQPASVTVQPGATTDVAVTFSPQRAGLVTAAASARLSVHAVGSPVTSLPYFPTLSGTGVHRNLLMDAGAVDFGEVAQGDTVQRPLTVTNTGTVPLLLSSGAIVRTGTGEPVGADEVEIALPAEELAPGATVAGTVTWHRAPADLDASVWINGADAGSPADVTSDLVPLTGTVTLPVTPPPTTPPTQPEPDPTPGVPATPDAPAGPGATTGGAGHDAATPARVLAVTGSGALFPVAAGAAGALLVGGLLLIIRRRSVRS